MARDDDRTALIVTDVQNDFADAAGSLYVPGGEEVIERVNAEVDRAMDAGSVVVYTQDWHPPSTPHFEKDGGIWPVHCVVGTWGAELHPRLRVIDGAPVVQKGTGGGRTATPGSPCATRRAVRSTRPCWRICFVNVA